MKDEYLPLVYNGNTFLPKHLKEYIVLEDEKKVRVYGKDGTFIAIYKFIKEKYVFKIEKMFFEREDHAVH